MMLTYFSLYFLNTHINMVKYLQRFQLDVSINWRYLHQDAGKIYSWISKMRSYWKYQKHPSSGIWKRKTKLSSTKEKYLRTTQVLARRDRKLFCKRSNDKSRHSTIYYPGDSFLSSAIKGWPERNSCSEERNLRQKWLEIRFKFAQKFFRKSAMCKIEIWNHQKESRSQFT